MNTGRQVIVCWRWLLAVLLLQLFAGHSAAQPAQYADYQVVQLSPAGLSDINNELANVTGPVILLLSCSSTATIIADQQVYVAIDNVVITSDLAYLGSAPGVTVGKTAPRCSVDCSALAATGYGAFAFVGSNVELHGFDLSSCSASAVTVGSSSLPTENYTISHMSLTNHTTSYTPGGGALAVVNALNLLIHDVEFSTCSSTAPDGGGAASIGYASTVTMAACQFVANGGASTPEGGAIKLYGNSILDLRRCTFSDNEAAAGGSIFNIQAAVNLDGCTVNNSTANSSSAVDATGPAASVNITNTTMRGNVPAALWLFNAQAVLVASQFAENGEAAVSGGGVIVAQAASSIAAANSQFVGNSAVQGGVIAMTDSCSFTANNCTFKGNVATDPTLGGGVVYAQVNNTFLLVGSTFTGNKATTGGVMYVQDANVVFDNCTISNNSASTEAGALYIYSANINVSNSRVMNNVALVGEGGAIEIIGNNTAQFRNTTFTGNSGTFGGAIKAQSLALLSFSDCILDSNIAQRPTFGGQGGAIMASLVAVVSLESVILRNNLAYLGGGLLAHGVNQMSFLNVQVINNTVIPSAGADLELTISFVEGRPHVSGSGAGLFLQRVNATASGMQFLNNTAQQSGGGVYGSNATFVGSNCSWAYNKASVYGGAMSMTMAGQGALACDGCNFTFNSGYGGGAVYADILSGAPTVNWTATNFISNIASQNDGGALHVFGQLNVSSNGCNFLNNRAQGAGGAWSCETCNGVEIDSTVFNNNTGGGNGGGVSCKACSALTVDRCQFSNNLATTGGGLLGTGMGSGGLSASVFISNSANESVPTTVPTCDGTGNGGGVCLAPSGPYILNSNTYDTNTATNGGGIFLEACSDIASCKVNFSDTTWNGNVAAGGGGGAVYVTALDVLIVKDANVSAPFDLATTDSTQLVQDAQQWQYILSQNNQAADDGYSPGAASDPVRIAASLFNETDEESGALTAALLQQNIISVTSGDTFLLQAQLEDKFGSLVRGGVASQYTAIKAVISGDTNAFLSGHTAASVVDGVSVLDQLALQGKPGENLTMTLLPFGSDPSAPADVTGHVSGQLIVQVRKCSIGQQLLDNNNCKTCDPQSISTELNAPSCIDCPPSFICEGAALVPVNGSWHPYPRSTDIYQCQLPAACYRDGLTTAALQQFQFDNANNAVVQDVGQYESLLCAEGYAGTLCGSCDVTPPDGGHPYGITCGRCQRCPSRASAIVAFIAARLLDFGLAVLLVVAMFKMIRHALVQQQAQLARPTQITDGLNTEISAVSEAKTTTPATTMTAFWCSVRATQDYVQIAALLAALDVHYIWPTWVSQSLMAVLLTPQSTWEWISSDCTQSTEPLIPKSIGAAVVAILLPVGFVWLAVTFQFLGSIARRRVAARRAGTAHNAPDSSHASLALPSSLLVAGLGVMSFFYPFLLWTTLNAFACTAVVHADANGVLSTKRVWTVDPDVQCFSGSHVSLALIAGLVGLPALLLYALGLGMVMLNYRCQLRGELPHRVLAWCRDAHIPWTAAMKPGMAFYYKPAFELLKLAIILVAAYTRFTQPMIQLFVIMILLTASVGVHHLLYVLTLPKLNGQMTFSLAALVMALFAGLALMLQEGNRPALAGVLLVLVIGPVAYLAARLTIYAFRLFIRT